MAIRVHSSNKVCYSCWLLELPKLDLTIFNWRSGIVKDTGLAIRDKVQVVRIIRPIHWHWMWSLLQEVVPALSKLELHSDSIRAQNLSVIAADFMSQFWRQTHPLRHFNTSVPDTRCYEIIEDKETRGVGEFCWVLTLCCCGWYWDRTRHWQGEGARPGVATIIIRQMRQHSLGVLRYSRWGAYGARLQIRSSLECFSCLCFAG